MGALPLLIHSFFLDNKTLWAAGFLQLLVALVLGRRRNRAKVKESKYECKKPCLCKTTDGLTVRSGATGARVDTSGNFYVAKQAAEWAAGNE